MSKEGGYTSQGWTHIPLLNRREAKDAYAPQREHFPETMKVCMLRQMTNRIFLFKDKHSNIISQPQMIQYLVYIW